LDFLVARAITGGDPERCYDQPLILALAEANVHVVHVALSKLKKRFGAELNLNQMAREIRAGKQRIAAPIESSAEVRRKLTFQKEMERADIRALRERIEKCNERLSRIETHDWPEFNRVLQLQAARIQALEKLVGLPTGVGLPAGTGPHDAKEKS